MFDLAAEVNNLNHNNTNFTVHFTKWYQNSPNDLCYANGARKPDGQVPTLTEVRANASLLGASSQQDETRLDAFNDDIDSLYANSTFLAEMARNIFEAHKIFLDKGEGGVGGDDFSEFAYIHNVLGYALMKHSWVWAARELRASGTISASQCTFPPRTGGRLMEVCLGSLRRSIRSLTAPLT